MDMAFVEVVAAGEAKKIFGENLFAEETRAALDIRSNVPSAGENEHYECATDRLMRRITFHRFSITIHASATMPGRINPIGPLVKMASAIAT